MREDDSVDVPQATIDREVQRAERMLADARTAHEVDISKATVVNRLYRESKASASGLDPEGEADT